MVSLQFPATNGIVAQIFGTKNISMLIWHCFFNHQIGSFLGAYLVIEYFTTHLETYDYAWYLAIVLSQLLLLYYTYQSTRDQ